MFTYFIVIAAVSLVVVAVQLSCFFSYQESKNPQVTALPDGCTEL